MTTRSKAAEATAEVKKTVDEAKAIGTDAAETAAAAGTKSMDQALSMAQSRMDTMVKGYDKVNAVTKQNIEAMVATSSAAMKSLESLNAEMLGYTKKSMEDTLAMTKALMAAKNPQEALEIHSEYTKATMDGFLSQSTKVTEMMSGMAKTMMEPITSRFAASTEQLSGKAA